MIAREREAAEGRMIVVDGGGSLTRPAGSTSGTPLPDPLGRAEVVAEALALGGLDAMALTPGDWALGAPAVRAIVERHHLPVLAGNLTCDGAAPFPGARRVASGGLVVGVVGVAVGEVPGCEVGDPIAALQREIAALGPVDLVVGLVPGDAALLGRVAAGVPELNVLVDADPRRVAGADTPQDPGRTSRAPGVGATAASPLVLSAGTRGHRVGVATLALVPSGAPEGGRWAPLTLTSWVERRAAELERAQQRLDGLRQRRTATPDDAANASARLRLDGQVQAADAQVARLRSEIAAHEGASGLRSTLSWRGVELDDTVPDHAATAQVVATYLAGLDPTGAAAAAAMVARLAPAGSPWVGADGCATCHPAETAQWLTTPHARAWQSLVDDGHAADPECYACHATGVGTVGGPMAPTAVGGLRDVQCEACHGAGRDHLGDAVGVKPAARPGVEACRGCHDGVRDGGRFDPATYLPQVVHRRPPAAPAAPGAPSAAPH